MSPADRLAQYLSNIILPSYAGNHHHQANHAPFAIGAASPFGTACTGSLLYRFKWKLRMMESASSIAIGRTSAIALILAVLQCIKLALLLVQAVL
jgi:hypothetical protein